MIVTVETGEEVLGCVSPSAALKDLAGSSLGWGSRYRFGCQKAVLSFAIQNVVCGPTALLIHTEPGTLGESCVHLGPGGTLLQRMVQRRDVRSEHW